MALRLEGPGDVRSADMVSFAPSDGGRGAHAPTWGVGNPVAVAMSGLQKSMERFADSYDDVKVNDYLMQKAKEFEDRYNNPKTGLFATRKRGSAQGLYEEEREYFSKLWDEDAAQQLSERQRRLAAKPLGEMFRHRAKLVASHETSELMHHQVDMAQNTVFDAQNLIASGTATEADLAMSLNSINIAYSALGKMQGWDADTVKRKQQEAFGSAIVKGSAAMSVSDPVAAMGMLNAFREVIPAEQYQGAMHTLDGRVREFNTNRYLEMISTPGREEEAQQFLLRNSPAGMRRGMDYSGKPTGKGNSIAEQLNNPLNLTKAGKTQSRSDYRSFETPEDGFMAAWRQLKLYQNRDGLVTPGQMISKWAPPGKNDTAHYIQQVGTWTGLKMNAAIDINNPKQAALLMYGMALQESPMGKRFTAADIEGFLAGGVKGQPTGNKSPAVIDEVSTAEGSTGQQLPDADQQRDLATILGGGAYQPGNGMFRPRDVLALEKRGMEIMGNRRKDAAYEVLCDVDPEISMRALNTPDIRARLGLTAPQADDVLGLLKTHWTNVNSLEKQAREKKETDALNNVLGIALGDKDTPGNPARAYQIVRDDPGIDGQTKLEVMKKLREGTLNQDDPGYVVGLQRMVAVKQYIPESELARGIATGRLSYTTKDRIKKMQEDMQGPQSGMIKAAYKALDEAMGRSPFAESGSPALAQAHYKAQIELQDAIEAAKIKGNVEDILLPTSKNYILPGIMQRNYVSMKDARDAMMQQMQAGIEQQQTTNSAVQQRNHGESIEEYMERIGGGGR